MSKKVYAVFQGHNPGLYSSWDEASQQVEGFKGAKYKSFPREIEAIEWLRECVLHGNEAVAPELIDLIKNHMDHNADGPESSLSDPNGAIIIHTDGGASPNPGVGGYGVVLQKGQRRKELSGGYKLTTNNRMEMMAVIVALQTLKEASKVVLHTDSKYIVDSVTKRWVYGWKKRGWKKSDGKRPENVDLWEVLIALLEKHRVDFRWVKGHAGNTENERCDALVAEARMSKNLLIDTGYKSS
ncbi:MAG: ribonuclease HI [Candidatus Marinimicrobia bacterium]|nr:ribonuclease HI [Candidatus Neomarinimicrobiota bacterium]